MKLILRTGLAFLFSLAALQHQVMAIDFNYINSLFELPDSMEKIEKLEEQLGSIDHELEEVQELKCKLEGNCAGYEKCIEACKGNIQYCCLCKGSSEDKALDYVKQYEKKVWDEWERFDKWQKHLPHERAQPWDEAWALFEKYRDMYFDAIKEIKKMKKSGDDLMDSDIKCYEGMIEESNADLANERAKVIECDMKLVMLKELQSRIQEEIEKTESNI